MEVLAIVREFATKDRRIPVENGMAKFDDKEYSMKTEVPLRAQGGKYYKLEDIWYLLQNKNKQWLQYMKECQQHSFAFVSFMDFKDILNYLSGASETTRCLDLNYEPTAQALPEERSSAFGSGLFPAGNPVALGAREDNSAAHADLPIIGDTSLGEDVAGTSQELFQEDQGKAQVVLLGEKERPLTADEQRRRAKKQATLRRDEEELLTIGQERSMKLKEILADAEKVREIQAKERPTVTLDVLLKSDTRNFKQYLNLMYLRQTEARNLRRPTANKRGRADIKADARPEGRHSSKSHGSRHGAHASSSSSSKKGKSSQEAIPIIIVPAAASTQIGLANVKDFLENGQWISLAKKKDELKSAAPIGKTTFLRHTQDEDGTKHSCLYEVYDNTSEFSSSHWKRVVAVFAFGKDWQFKGWPLGDAGKMFQKVCGFYVGFRGEPVPPAISNWNITSLLLDKSSRHLDTIAYRQFWDRLDKHVAEHFHRLKTR